MTLDRTVTRRRTTPDETETDRTDPLAAEASPILEQAAGFAEVARQAHAESQRGTDAVEELQLRRNRSGQ